MGALATEDSDFLSHLKKIDESQAEIENTSLYHHLINNHALAANKGKTKGQLSVDYILGFCGTVKKNY